MLEDIEKKAYVILQVKYGLIRLVNTQADLCDQVSNVDLECPIKKGKTTITKDVELPKEIPPVRALGSQEVHLLTISAFRELTPSSPMPILVMEGKSSAWKLLLHSEAGRSSTCEMVQRGVSGCRAGSPEGRNRVMVLFLALLAVKQTSFATELPSVLTCMASMGRLFL